MLATDINECYDDAANYVCNRDHTLRCIDEENAFTCVCIASYGGITCDDGMYACSNKSVNNCN